MNPGPVATLGTIAAVLSLAPSIAAAQEQDRPSQVSVAVTGGTLGIGPEIGFRPVPLIGVRASASFLGFGHNVDVRDIDYHGDARIRNYGATADLYPFRNAFRLSAGFRVSDNRVDLVATPSRAVAVGQTTYTPDQIGTIEGKVKANKVSPTFTIGVAKNLRQGFAWSLDAGVMLHGRPRTYDVVATGELATNPLFQADLARERAEIEDEVDNYKVYPIVQLTVGYAF